MRGGDHAFEMRGMVVLDHGYFMHPAFRDEIVHAFETASCALFGRYSTEAVRKDVSGRLAREMSFCSLFEHTTTELTSADIATTILRIGDEDGYVGSNIRIPNPGG